MVTERRTSVTDEHYTAELTIKGDPQLDSEMLFAELFELAKIAHSMFYKDTEDQAVEAMRYAVERVIEDEGKPSEFDLGFQAGQKTYNPDTGEAITTGPKVGDKVRITGRRGTMRHHFQAGDEGVIKAQPDGSSVFYIKSEASTTATNQYVNPVDFEVIPG